jgi:hypothetical protein
MPNNQEIEDVFYFKALHGDERLRGHTVESSARLAKGTLYSAWFDTLQTSPWYAKICDGGGYKTGGAEYTHRMFGDLRGKSFASWWRETGYRIFSEVVPYSPITVRNQSEAPVNAPGRPQGPVLVVEIPLYYDDKAVREQVSRLLDSAREQYQYEWDRRNPFVASTAAVPLHQELKRGKTVADIETQLMHYRMYREARLDRDLKMYEFARQIQKPGHIFTRNFRDEQFDATKRAEATKYVSDYLHSTRYLMYNATQGHFPSFEPVDASLLKEAEFD